MKNMELRGLYGRSALALVTVIMFTAFLFMPTLFVYAQAAGPTLTTSQADTLGLGSQSSDVSLVDLCGSGLDFHRCTLNDVSAACLAHAENCTPADQNALKVIAGCSPSASFWNSALPIGFGGNYYSYGCSDTQTQQSAQAGQILSHVAACIGGLSSITPYCLFSGLLAGIIEVLVQLAYFLLTIAGGLFSWLVVHTVVEFSSLYSGIQSGVEIGWSAFRDIANILIIGIFTFIAISIILGLKTYGQKKMIARVLIIAILINFSLLFSKIIIDASNYTALQIYSAAGFGTGESNSAAAAATVSGGISDQFIGLMRVSSFGDAASVVYKIASTDNIGTALIYGVLIFLVLVGAALILLYGSFLLVSRVIIIIFLFVTASLAFASYLVPAWEKSHYGWGVWWNSLIKSAVFAPIIMLFLWITLTVGSQLKTTNGDRGSFGNVAANPTSVDNINTLFSYAVILGMLFVSFRLSSAFAGKIAGFNYASMTTALPFTLSSRLAGFALRNATGLGGRGSARRSLALDERIETQRDKARNAAGTDKLKEYSELERLMRSKQRADKRAGSSFNLMNTGTAKGVMAGLGVSGFAAGADKKAPSYAESAKGRAEKAAKEAAGLSLSAEDREKLQGGEATKKRDELRRHKEILTEQERAHEQQIEVQKDALKEQTQALKAERASEASVKAELEKKHDRILDTLSKKVTNATDPTVRADAQERLTRAHAARQSEIEQQDSKIKNVDERIKDVTAPLTELEEKLKGVKKEIEGLSDDSIARAASKHATAAVRKIEDENRKVAMQMGARLAYGSFSSLLQRSLGIDPEKTVPGKMAFKQTKKKMRIRGQVDRLTALQEEAKGAGESIEGMGETAAS